MNRWYNIELVRKERDAKLIIDKKTETTVQSPKKKTVLDISAELYFGGHKIPRRT